MLAGFIIFVVFAMIFGLASKIIPRVQDIEGEKHDFTVWRRVAGGVAVACVLVAGLFVFLDSLNVVQAGHAGLVRRMGAVTGRHVGPGVNFTMPFIEDLVVYDTRVQKVPFENLEAASAEYQLVGVKGTLNYRINPAAVPWLFENVGSQHELEEKVLVPALQQNLKAVMPRYAILDILPQRDQIATQLTAAMDATFANYTTDSGVPVVYFAPQELVEEGEQGCVVARPADDPATTVNEAATAILCPATVYLENVDFSDQFDQALEDKQVQQTKIDTERNILEQVELKKQQRITEAEGEAEANRLIAESLRAEGGLEALQLKAIEKLGDDVRVIILPSDSNLIPLLGEQLLTGQ